MPCNSDYLEEIRAALDADEAWRLKRALAGIRCRCPIRYDQSHNQDCPLWLVNWRWPQLITQLRTALDEIEQLQKKLKNNPNGDL